jgi:hypothetical protein
MDISAILAELKQQRDKIQQAIDALQSVGGTTTTKAPGRKTRRVMSADARRRIGLAMKKRWAERKKTEKKAA